MRQVKLIPLGACLLLSTTVFSQTITLQVQRAPLKQVLDSVKRQSGYHIFYNQSLLTATKPVSVNARQVPLREFLRIILADQPLEARISGTNIYFSEKATPPPPVTDNPNLVVAGSISIRGKVVSSDGLGLPRITVKVLPSKKGTFTADDGSFSLLTAGDDDRIEISGVGMITISVPIAKLRSLAAGKKLSGDIDVTKSVSGDYVFEMQKNTILVNEVVVVNTGMFTRRQESFTGVTHTISGDELRLANRQNILEGLNTLDPSFRIIRDNNLGSNPNQLPKIEMRGTRAMPSPTAAGYSQQLRLQYEQDPNQPLFILDGFEVSLQDVVNLDINRIGSLVLLKDAASTALYGPRSANGVVVIETIKPTPGKLRIAYTVNAGIAVPDLSGYDMMNASELLQFQELAGANGPYVRSVGQGIADAKHDARKNEIMRGVNTYWLGVPLRNAFSSNHNLSVTGGDYVVNYTLGISRNINNGVMKQSSSGNTAAFAVFSYRKKKFNITNNFRYTGTKQQESPYGSFSDYVKIPPYYRKYDEYGHLNRAPYLEDLVADEIFSDGSGSTYTSTYRYNNPLYNASLPYRNETKGNQVNNSLNMYWDVLPSLRISAGGMYLRDDRTGDFFVSPLNTSFDQTVEQEKGSYNFSRSVNTTYQANAMLTYNKVFAGKHILNMNVRGDMSKTDGENISITGVGFASTAAPLLFLAGSYLPNSKPGGGENYARRVGLTFSANYSYDNRYNFDFSYNTTGTNNFGSDQPFQSFYSVGAGWNIGKEAFFGKSDFVNALRLTTNFGLTGNEVAGGFGSRSTYVLNNQSTINGEATSISKVGNPFLNWSKTYKLSYGIDGIFLRNKLSLSLSGYMDRTDPMIVPLPIPPSTGLPSIPTNIGILKTVGMDLMVNYKAVNNKKWTWNIGFNSPLFLRSQYSGLGNKLETFTKQARDNQSLLRFMDGSGPYDIWAVRSVGIDPQTGQELFLDKNGYYTFLFNSINEVKVGNSRPITQGNINTQLRYQRFTLAIYCRYAVGEMKFNNALYQKVENITLGNMDNNQDRRALYSRWKQPGDNASFLGIDKVSQGLSDRFLQKENAIYFESVALNYDFNSLLGEFAKKKLGISRLDFSLNLNEFFRFQLSNIRLERGLDYPFARNASCTLSVGF